jgi:hypothetical protein
MTFAPGSRDPQTPGLCQARTRQSGGPPCRNYGIRPSGRCRLHGGRSLRGIASPTFVHGRRSRDWLLRGAWLAAPGGTPQAAEAAGAARETGAPGTGGDTPQEGTLSSPHATAGVPMEDEKGAAAGVAPEDGAWSWLWPETGVSRPPTRQERGRPPTPQEVGEAAAWCVQGGCSQREIARRMGISPRTLARWRQRPEYAAAVAAIAAWQVSARGDGSVPCPHCQSTT